MCAPLKHGEKIIILYATSYIKLCVLIVQSHTNGAAGGKRCPSIDLDHLVCQSKTLRTDMFEEQTVEEQRSFTPVGGTARTQGALFQPRGRPLLY